MQSKTYARQHNASPLYFINSRVYAHNDIPAPRHVCIVTYTLGLNQTGKYMLIDDVDYSTISEDPTLLSISKLIGEDLTIKMLQDLGGRWLYIASDPSETSPIVSVIGLKAAQKLGKVYGGCRYAVPVKIAKAARVLQLLKEGVPIVRISQILSMSPGGVRGIAKRYPDHNLFLTSKTAEKS